jgi:DNA polymerase I-like protein with 3'-5' exonuclease and polymerase domains
MQNNYIMPKVIKLKFLEILNSFQIKADEFADKIKDLMQNAYPLNIPLKVDVGVGVSWQEAH